MPPPRPPAPRHDGAVVEAFPSLVARIEEAYAALDHRLGWRFLYGPARTLTSRPRLAFVGLNPGGAVHQPPVPSVEEGNAYRVERWGGDGGLNPLQVQIGLLYAGLAERLESASPADLMDATLAVNFCPFRSPSWEALPKPAESVRFSRELWQSILTIARPRVFLCLGDLASRHLGQVLELGGWTRAGPPRRLPAGWGSVSYGVTSYAVGRDTALIVRLPHLSRFGIFGRDASAGAAAELLATVAAAARA